ncbi:DUF3369 domain-containing protein [Chitiniphilus eburneus]|uniref:DUF3369 domain-containing protein n=1 Tax=Chitiniphilus eburneus TaxID=2571148 RepID=UPI0035D0C38B
MQITADEDWLIDDSKTLEQAALIDPWNVLIVDDEPDIHQVTRLALGSVQFLGRPLNLLSCYSGHEAVEFLASRDDVALILLDVVMESEEAGLRTARLVREQLGNHRVRIILRTGQPGAAPEREVIESYDINDYKAKTELTRDKLYTAVLGTLRSYRDIMLIEQQRQMLEANRRGLLKVVDASSTIFRLQSMQQFAQGVLEQLQALLFFEQEALYVVVNGAVSAVERDQGMTVLYATGGYADLRGKPLAEADLSRFGPAIDLAIRQGSSVFGHDHFVGFFHSPHGAANLLIIDGPVALSNADRELVELFCRNVAIAFDNLIQHEETDLTQRDIIHRLAEVVETHGQAPGQHNRRVTLLAGLLAEELGWKAHEIAQLQAAVPLYDIGKAAIADAVLRKPATLDEAERHIMETHAALGRDLMGKAGNRTLQLAARIAHQHHERWDGTGYPQGLAGEAIDPAARIVALLDVYDALGHARVHRPPWPREDVLEALRLGRASQFDPAVVDAFFKVLPRVEAIAAQWPDAAYLH